MLYDKRDCVSYSYYFGFDEAIKKDLEKAIRDEIYRQFPICEVVVYANASDDDFRAQFKIFLLGNEIEHTIWFKPDLSLANENVKENAELCLYGLEMHLVEIINSHGINTNNDDKAADDTESEAIEIAIKALNRHVRAFGI